MKDCDKYELETTELGEEREKKEFNGGEMAANRILIGGGVRLALEISQRSP